MYSFFHQLFLVLCYGGIVLSVFIVLLLNGRDVRKGRANVYLSILLLALAFSVAHILFAGAVVSHLSTKVYSVGDPTFFLIAPLLWFYTCALGGEKSSIGQRILHFVPFLFIVTLSLTLRSIENSTLTTLLVEYHNAVFIIFWILLIVQFSTYLLMIRNRWRTFSISVENEVSNKENVSITWVRFYMIVFLIVNVIFLCILFVAIHYDDRSVLVRSTAVIFSLSIFAIGYKGILQREIFLVDAAAVPAPAPSAVHVRTNEQEQRLQELKAFMENNRPYLDPDLTLTELATRMNTTRGALSALINEAAGSNFYDFVNRYRVEQVKKLMADPAMKNYNVLGIALEAGFRSKSTFNLIFKRFTGLTPSEYKRNMASTTATDEQH